MYPETNLHNTRHSVIGHMGDCTTETACPPRVSHTERELAHLEGAVARTEDAVSKLAQCLAPVLYCRPGDPTACGEKDDPIAPVADRIRSSRKRLEAVEAGILTLIDSLEI